MKKLLFMICGVLLLTSCSSNEKANSKSNKLTVKSFTAKNETLNGDQNFSFISKPYRSTLLSFRVGGPIEKFDVRSGSYYRKGEVIASIDPRDFKIRAERAEAIYRQAEAEFKRIEILYKKDNISASQFEKARAEYVSAKAAYETASNELKDTKLIAPFDGYVGEVFIEKFQDVKATQQIISFDEIDRLKIEVYVPQTIAFDAKKLKTVNLSFDAIPNEEFTATVEEISKSTTKNNISYLLTAVLPNSNERLLAGMSGKMNLHIAEGNSILIPQSALRNRPTVGNYVWVINPATSVANLRIVKTGKLQNNGEVTVLEGLNEGETIAITGQDFIEEGNTVVVNNN